MKFDTMHNGQKVTIEYDEDDAADQEGSVGSCEITYQGQIVSKLLADHEDVFIEKCCAHFDVYCAEKKFDGEMDRGQERYEDARCEA